MNELPRKTALITGAAGGIGRALAFEFAADGCDVVGVDRSGNELRSLAADLEKAYPDIVVTTLDMDLSEANAAEALHQTCVNQGLRIDVLVNNVGFGKMGEHVLQSPAVVTDMLNLNNLLMTKLCLLFGSEMKARRQGQILNVASLVGFSASPFFSAYSGTKAYAIAFSVGLARELGEHGVQVSCLCPGTTKTNFLDAAEIDDQSSKGMRRFASAFMSTPDVVARAGITGLKKKRLVIVPTLFLKVQSFFLRVLPVETVSGAVYSQITKANAKASK
jgi:uncharacterized protein